MINIYAKMRKIVNAGFYNFLCNFYFNGIYYL